MLDGRAEGGVYLTIYRAGVKDLPLPIGYEPHSINLNHENLKRYMNE
jgi:hypothetical protein